MSQEQPTAGNVASSGGMAGSGSYRAPSRRKILGNIPELEDWIFRFNEPDQQNMYFRTRDDLADYVGAKPEFGHDMKMLVKYGTEKELNEPTLSRETTAEPGRGDLDVYRVKLKLFQEDKRKYMEQKAQVFTMILGQCSQMARSRLENDEEFRTWEIDRDVVKVMKKLEMMAFSSEGVAHPAWALQRALNRLFSLHQGPTEPIASFQKRLTAQLEVVKALWGGNWSPPALMSDGLTEDEAQGQLWIMILLAGVDKKRFGSLLDGLNNDYLAGQDRYPSDIDSTVTLLSNYRDHQVHGGRQVANNAGATRVMTETSFAQRQGQGRRNRQRVRGPCFNCNQPGHIAANCPLREQQQHIQREERESQDGDSAAARAAAFNSNVAPTWHAG